LIIIRPTRAKKPENEAEMASQPKWTISAGFDSGQGYGRHVF
jgi:hypothetical protein